jgi:hypothetical protein
VTTLPSLDQRVRNMAAVLDEARPGWRGQVDADTINFDSTSDCVLGQLYGNYLRGLNALGHDLYEPYWTELHGVELPVEERDGSYGRLTDAWKTYLRSNAA